MILNRQEVIDMVNKYGVYESFERFEKEFEEFEERVLKEYDGSYYLSLDKLGQMFKEEKKKEYGVNDLYVYFGGEEISIHQALYTLYDVEQKQKEYDRVMSKFIDREEALELINESMYDLEYYFSDLEDVIAGRLDLDEYDRSYYYKTLLPGEKIWGKAGELRKEIAKKLFRDEGEIELGEAFATIFYESMQSYARELCEEFGLDEDAVVVDFDDNGWNFRVYVKRDVLTFGYDYDKDKVAKEILLYMEKHYGLPKVLDYDDFAKQNEETIEEIYREGLSHPDLEKIIQMLEEESKNLLKNLTAEVLMPYIELEEERDEEDEDEDNTRGKNRGRRR